MPLTHKGQVIKKALQEEYGEEKGERVLYAGENKGTFTGIDEEPDQLESRKNTWPTQTLRIDVMPSGRVRITRSASGSPKS